MLTVILNGRNDEHGYNYPKRLAISLNCIAELLTDPIDEILFVDYNSSNDLPSIIEAIQDTLTPKTHSLIKVLRVRPHIHKRFKTHLPILEPVARNAAIRRSRPENKWILSTNADMIFVPENPELSLSEIVADLDEGYYSLPRFELPENLWELSLNRLDPSNNLSFLRKYSEKLHLNTIVRKEGFLHYDNPGDFQLMLRKDIVAIGGFDETMVKGWHVDSNVYKRLSLFQKPGKPLENILKGYHCNHTLKETAQNDRIQNSWNKFVMNDDIVAEANGPDWGLLNDTLEEVRLHSNHHVEGISKSQSIQSKESDIIHNQTLYNKLTYSTTRVFTHLVDHLCNEQKSINIVYIGHNQELVQMLESYLKSNHFTGKIDSELGDLQAALFVFDFGFDENFPTPEKKLLKRVMKSFLHLMSKKNAINPAAKFIGINITYTDFHVVFLKHLSMRLSSYVTGSSYGYLKGRQAPTPFPLMVVKKKLVLNLRYFLIRYLFKYTDRIRRYVLRTKLSKIL